MKSYFREVAITIAVVFAFSITMALLLIALPEYFELVSVPAIIGSSLVVPIAGVLPFIRYRQSGLSLKKVVATTTGIAILVSLSNMTFYGYTIGLTVKLLYVASWELISALIWSATTRKHFNN